MYGVKNGHFFSSRLLQSERPLGFWFSGRGRRGGGSVGFFAGRKLTSRAEPLRLDGRGARGSELHVLIRAETDATRPRVTAAGAALAAA